MGRNLNQLASQLSDLGQLLYLSDPGIKGDDHQLVVRPQAVDQDFGGFYDLRELGVDRSTRVYQEHDGERTVNRLEECDVLFDVIFVNAEVVLTHLGCG